MRLKFLKNRQAITGKVKHSWKRGFSFTEVLLVMSLFILLAGVGIGAYFNYYRSSLVRIEANKVLSHVKEARFRALKNSDYSDYGVHLDPACRCLTIYKNTYSPANPGNITLVLEQMGITDLNLAPNPGITSDILFNKQTGKTENTGSFTVGSEIESFTFTINSQGVVD